MVLTQVLFIAGYDILPIVFEKFPLWLTDDVDYLRGMDMILSYDIIT